LPSTAPAQPRARSMRPPPLPRCCCCCCCCCCCYHCYCCCCCRRRRRQPLQSARLSGPRGAARRSHARRCADSWRLPRGRGGAAPHRAGQWLQGAAAHAPAHEPRRASLAPCAWWHVPWLPGGVSAGLTPGAVGAAASAARENLSHCPLGGLRSCVRVRARIAAASPLRVLLHVHTSGLRNRLIRHVQRHGRARRWHGTSRRT
jgi:hypothetical protein